VLELFTASVNRSKQLSKRPLIEFFRSIYGYLDMGHQRCVILTTKASIPLSLSITGISLKMGVPENTLPDIAHT
jgi:hypothetical protein